MELQLVRVRTVVYLVLYNSGTAPSDTLAVPLSVVHKFVLDICQTKHLRTKNDSPKLNLSALPVTRFPPRAQFFFALLVVLHNRVKPNLIGNDRHGAQVQAPRLRRVRPAFLSERVCPEQGGLVRLGT